MEHNSEEQMKLIRHGTEIVPVNEHQREKAYLILQRGKQEWVSLFPVGDTTPVAEMNRPTFRCVSARDKQWLMNKR
jgi:hypothetical protein